MSVSVGERIVPLDAGLGMRERLQNVTVIDNVDRFVYCRDNAPIRQRMRPRQVTLVEIRARTKLHADLRLLRLVDNELKSANV